ncbi:hypothetical protein [Nannocystis pusilla]|uniref:hypothetical protein n=1 Tax=Nannocystis pusilla TaxID=889268 RepID=UPI003B75E387
MPSQNEPRLHVTIDGPIGRFSIASLLRSTQLYRPGSSPALVRVRSITPPNDGTWRFRSANATEQPETTGPVGIDMPLDPAWNLTQQWGYARQAGPTDAVSVILEPALGDPDPQIEIEVAELSGDLAALWLAAQNPTSASSSQDRRYLALTTGNSPLSLTGLTAGTTLVEVNSDDDANVLTMCAIPTDLSKVLKITNVGANNFTVQSLAGNLFNGVIPTLILMPGRAVELQAFSSSSWNYIGG